MRTLLARASVMPLAQYDALLGALTVAMDTTRVLRLRDAAALDLAQQLPLLLDQLRACFHIYAEVVTAARRYQDELDQVRETQRDAVLQQQHRVGEVRRALDLVKPLVDKMILLLRQEARQAAEQIEDGAAAMVERLAQQHQQCREEWRRDARARDRSLRNGFLMLRHEVARIKTKHTSLSQEWHAAATEMASVWMRVRFEFARVLDEKTRMAADLAASRRQVIDLRANLAVWQSKAMMRTSPERETEHMSVLYRFDFDDNDAASDV